MCEQADRIGQLRKRREAAAAEKARRKRLEKIAADPQSAIEEAEKLIKNRSTSDYVQAAKILADLSEALGPTDGPPRAQAAAECLRKKYPTLTRLVSTFRKHGVLPKR